MLRLAGELAVESASKASCSSRRRCDERRLPAPARAAGLGGFEFACAIPGTAGGGVRMNAGAYGSDWSEILVARAGRHGRGRAAG